MKILVTAIGSLAADSVITSLRKSEPESEIFGTDIYPEHWLIQSRKVDRFFQIPKALHDDYINTLFDICVVNHVNYVIPLVDFEVDRLSAHEEKFKEAGITVCISPPSAINICRNKFSLYNFFKEIKGVDVIPSYEYHEINSETFSGKAIVKPKKGRSSEGVFVCNDFELFLTKTFSNKEIIFQPYYTGDIYTLDIIRDSFGHSVSVARKEVIRNRSGVGLTVCVKEQHKLNYTAKLIVEKLNVKGAINIEFLYSDGVYYLMDINPRFSAGIRYTIQSGYDIVSNHLNCFKGLPVDKLSNINGGIYFFAGNHDMI